MVEPSFAKRSLINHHEYLPGASIITSDAVGIDREGQVTTKEGFQIAYDYLVIATGHMSKGCVTKSERIKQFEAGIFIKLPLKSQCFCRYNMLANTKSQKVISAFEYAVVYFNA